MVKRVITFVRKLRPAGPASPPMVRSVCCPGEAMLGLPRCRTCGYQFVS